MTASAESRSTEVTTRTPPNPIRSAATTARLLAFPSLPGSVRYDVEERTALDDYVASHSPAGGPAHEGVIASVDQGVVVATVVAVAGGFTALFWLFARERTDASSSRGHRPD